MLENILHFLPLDDRVATAGQPTEAQIADIAAAGYEVVLNLALPTSTGALPHEEELVCGHGMGYIAIPVVWENPTSADFARFCAAMDENRSRRLFIHCAANMRVSAFMALYRILRLHWEPARAFEDLHRIWHPEDHPVWGPFMTKILEYPADCWPRSENDAT